MEQFLPNAAALVLIEAVVYYVGQFFQREVDPKQIAALVAAVLASVVFQWDVFAGEAAIVPYVGSVLTGIVFARGSNFAHDAFTWVRARSA